ncbi:MAG: ABC transporter substrate-binding protein [Burkholderiaceae bacterium]|nr:MAG: ABC transporter substrate-binding protein [Burkholderiaceae bacterium]
MEIKMSGEPYPFFKKAVGLACAMVLGMVAYTPSYALDKVRVGATVAPDLNAVAVCLAIDDGAFAKAGLGVDLSVFAQSNLKYDAMKAGSLDVDVGMGAINAAQLYSSGVPIVVLRGGTRAAIWAVIGLKNSTFTKPADFKGKKFAVISFSGTNYGVTYLAFKAEGVDFRKDVEVSALPPSAIVPALVKGEIAGATTFEPFLTNDLKTGAVKVLFRPGEIYEKKYHEPLLAVVVAAHKSFVTNHHEDAKKFMAVLNATRDSLGAHAEAAAVAFVKHMPQAKMTVPEAKELIVQNLSDGITSENTPAFIESVQHLYDRLLAAHQLKEPVRAADFYVML